MTVNDRQHVYDSPRRLEGEKLGNESSSSREMADGVAVLTVSSSCRPFFFPLLLAHVNEEIVAGIASNKPIVVKNQESCRTIRRSLQ